MRLNRGQILKKAAAALTMAGAMFATALRAEEIPIAVGIDPTFVSFFVAKQERLFEKHGVDVKLLSFGPGGAMLDAVTGGQAVMSASTETTTLVRMARTDIRAIAIVGRSTNNVKLVARHDVDDPRKIRSIGVVPGGVFEYINGLTFKAYGIDPASVKVVKAGPPELPALLLRGDIDAFWLFEPFPTMTRNQGARILAEIKDVGYISQIWVSAKGDWLEKNRASAVKVLAALKEACEIVTADPKRGADAVQANVKIPAAQTLDYLKELQCRLDPIGSGDLPGYENISAFLHAAKIIPAPVDLRVKVVVDFPNR
ncbi:MAG: hypothetical protein BGP06_13070 [Rhizobiales bacterium 65-9]|nr:ABC transporter substrate-binding protein [Hyphomicrobiales bacterium]OJY39337.1 MAG: hypothetical protein BGP06_13070 [Rhizobiales bacterium 65-9]